MTDSFYRWMIRIKMEHELFSAEAFGIGRSAE